MHENVRESLNRLIESVKTKIRNKFKVLLLKSFAFLFLFKRKGKVYYNSMHMFISLKQMGILDTYIFKCFTLKFYSEDWNIFFRYENCIQISITFVL